MMAVETPLHEVCLLSHLTLSSLALLCSTFLLVAMGYVEKYGSDIVRLLKSNTPHVTSTKEQGRKKTADFLRTKAKEGPCSR